jgi:hypothetical protein
MIPPALKAKKPIAQKTTKKLMCKEDCSIYIFYELVHIEIVKTSIAA